VTSQPPPIDITYLADALVRIDGDLHRATVDPDPAEQEQALIRAGMIGCAALTRLRDDQELWARLHTLHQDLQQWRDVQGLLVARLLTALRHSQPEPAQTLVRTANTLLQEAAGFPAPQREDPVTEAQELIDELSFLICALEKLAHRRQWWMGTARATLRLLGAVFLAAVALPGAQAGLREVAPHAVDLLRELAEHVGQALPSLSMSALVTSTRLAREDMTDLSQHYAGLRAEHHHAPTADSGWVQAQDTPDQPAGMAGPAQEPDQNKRP
jgi:hypothetical protein